MAAIDFLFCFLGDGDVRSIIVDFSLPRFPPYSLFISLSAAGNLVLTTQFPHYFVLFPVLSLPLEISVTVGQLIEEAFI